jgi:uroporphyrinogen decarboxylase
MSYEERPAATPSVTKPVIEVLAGRRQAIPPVWLMRQAGRYLPEYRALRGQAGSFLDLCYTPAMAAEVTLQPVRRFGFDAAILFSDILVVPHALGQDLSFEAGEGPRLAPVVTPETLHRFRMLDATRLAPIYETVRRVRTALPAGTTFLGFCGAPWTVASYMVAGRGGDEQVAVRRFAYADPAGFGELIDILIEASLY